MVFRKKNKETNPELEQGTSEALKILMTNIPGYLGYKKQEIRKQSDIAFRKKLLEILRTTDDAMSQVHELLIHSQLLTSWGPAQMIKKKIEELRRETANPDYKYTTFFDIDDVEGDMGIDLSILYLLEIEILDLAEEYKELVAKTKQNLEEMILESVEEQISRILNKGNELFERYNERNELIRAFEKMKL
ncbi:MAG: hypothetical protein ACTSYD_05560 [Candidatus Heimdallarchaeaceae archaeon]